MSILIIAEHDNTQLMSATGHTITAGNELGEVTVLVVGSDCQSAADEAAQLNGVNKVILVDSDQYEHHLAEQLAPVITDIASGYTHILAPATNFGKDLAPRIAALLDIAQISDVISIVTADTFKRPIYAGNIIETVQSSDKIKLLTIRSTAFDKVVQGDTCFVESKSPKDTNCRTEFIREELTKSDRPELTTASYVISGGRGVGSAENFTLLEELADTLGGAVGASRAAVDAGFVSNDYQVGQTGKIVAPDIYFAIGISGAIQHLAGMKDSKIIVAINKDEEAPIFEVADYGLVADLFQAVPELINSLGNR